MERFAPETVRHYEDMVIDNLVASRVKYERAYYIVKQLIDTEAYMRKRVTARKLAAIILPKVLEFPHSK